MSPQVVAHAVQEAEKLIALADALNEVYPTYNDGRGQEHYVPGPATRQFREAVKALKDALNEFSWNTACALPEIHLQ